MNNKISKKPIKRRYLELMHYYSGKYPKVFMAFRFATVLTIFRLFKEYGFRPLFKEFLLSFKKVKRYSQKRENIGILVESLDKGGLEQAVYNLVTNTRKVDIFVFIVGSESGDIANNLKGKGYCVYILNSNFELFKNLVKRKNIKKINTHFSVWNLDKMKDLGLEVIYTVHSQYAWITAEDEIEERKRMYKYVDKFVAVSKTVRNYFSEKFGIREERIKVIPNGLDSKDFHKEGEVLQEVKNLSKGNDFVFLNVASFVPIKNHFLLLSVLNEVKKVHNNVQLWLVGNIVSEEYKNRIDQTIKELSLEKNIKIFDFMDKHNLAHLYKKADCFVLPSFYEGCPNVLLEALYFSLPVISADVGNAKELLDGYGMVVRNSYKNLLEVEKGGLDNLLYSLNQDNKEEFVNAMLELIENKKEWGKKAKKGSAMIRNQYNIKNTARRYQKIYLDN